MYLVNLDEPLVVSAASLQLRFNSYFTEINTYQPIEAYVPAEPQLVTIEDLRTPFENNLQGLRISPIGGMLKIYNREGDKVVVSKKVDLEEIIKNFKSLIRSSVSRLPQHCIDDGIVVYKMETLKKLLKDIFQNEIPPRLIPELKWPDEKTIIDIIKQNLPKPPYDSYKFNHSAAYTCENGVHRFIITGERGGTELELANKNIEEFCLELFKYFTREDARLLDFHYYFDLYNNKNNY
jgi:hypothetical protein